MEEKLQFMYPTRVILETDDTFLHVEEENYLKLLEVWSERADF